MKGDQNEKLTRLLLQPALRILTLFVVPLVARRYPRRNKPTANNLSLRGVQSLGRSATGILFTGNFVISPSRRERIGRFFAAGDFAPPAVK